MKFGNLKRLGVFASLAAVLILSLFAAGCAQDSPTEVSEEQKAELWTEFQLSEEYLQALEDAKSLVDVTEDNEAAVLDAIGDDERLFYDLETGKVVVNETEDTSVDDDTQTEFEEVEVSVQAYTKEYYLGEEVSRVLDDSELEVLFDGEIDFDDQDIDVKETIELSSDLHFAYSGDNVYDDEFGAEPYLVSLARDAVAYVYTFEDDVALEDISDDTPLEFNFLGMELSVTSASSGSFTYVGSESHYLGVGETVDVDGQVVLLTDVSTDSVVVEVNGVTEIVSEGQTETVDGVKVYVESTFSRDSRDDSYAMLVVGEDAKQTVDSGDYYDDEEYWEWDVVDDGTYLQSISLVLDEKFNKLDSDIAALGVGECLPLPTEYVSLCFESTSEPDYTKLEVDFDEIDVEDVDVKVTSVVADDDVFIVDDENVKSVYSDGTDVYYEDDNDFVVADDGFVLVDLGDAEYELTFDSLGQVLLTDEDGNEVYIDAHALDEQLGDESDDAETLDVVYNGEGVGTRDYDVLTAFGVKLVDVESNADSDTAELWLPDEKLELTMAVSA